MALSQGFQQKLLQKLSPQQIQLMKLLQVPTAQLEERIKEEMEENPALEPGEDGHDDEYSEENDEFKETEKENVIPNEIIIYNSFARQWCLVNLTQWKRQIDWLEYLCLYYCYHKETTRKQALELQKHNVSLP